MSFSFPHFHFHSQFSGSKEKHKPSAADRNSNARNQSFLSTHSVNLHWSLVQHIHAHYYHSKITCDKNNVRERIFLIRREGLKFNEYKMKDGTCVVRKGNFRLEGKEVQWKYENITLTLGEGKRETAVGADFILLNNNKRVSLHDKISGKASSWTFRFCSASKHWDRKLTLNKRRTVSCEMSRDVGTKERQECKYIWVTEVWPVSYCSQLYSHSLKDMERREHVFRHREDRWRCTLHTVAPSALIVLCLTDATSSEQNYYYFFRRFTLWIASGRNGVYVTLLCVLHFDLPSLASS